MAKKTTIHGDDYEQTTERVTLPEPFYESAATGQEDYTGVWVTGLYYGPRSGRCFVETYSIWDDGHGRCTGERIREATLSDLLAVAEHVGARLPACIPAAMID